MLRVGLTGGIGSGKSTVARLLADHGAVVVDADRVAREVVEPGTPGLAAIAAAFGPEYLTGAGALDRPRMAATVFGDDAARARLNAIVHPLVRRRCDELVAAAPVDGVVVEDIPLLVDGALASRFALVVVVLVDAEERVRRLVAGRGMAEDDARARIRAQSGDDALRAIADVVVDNGSDTDALAEQVAVLWRDRITGYRDNLLRGTAATVAPGVTGPDPDWPAAAARLGRRVATAAGGPVEHVGPTAVGLPSADVLDLQLTADPADPAVGAALREVGFVAVADGLAAAADPGRPARVWVSPAGAAAGRDALAVRDWLRADDTARAELAAAPPDQVVDDSGRWRAAVVERGRAWPDPATRRTALG